MRGISRLSSTHSAYSKDAISNAVATVDGGSLRCFLFQVDKRRRVSDTGSS